MSHFLLPTFIEVDCCLRMSDPEELCASAILQPPSFLCVSKDFLLTRTTKNYAGSAKMKFPEHKRIQFARDRDRGFARFSTRSAYDILCLDLRYHCNLLAINHKSVCEQKTFLFSEWESL